MREQGDLGERGIPGDECARSGPQAKDALDLAEHITDGNRRNAGGPVPRRFDAGVSQAMVPGVERVPRGRHCAMQCGVESAPAEGIRGGEDDDARRPQRRRQVGDAGVVTNDEAGVGDEGGERTEVGLAREVRHHLAGRPGDARVHRPLAGRPREHDGDSPSGEVGGHGGEPLEGPAPPRVLGSGMHDRELKPAQAAAGDLVQPAPVTDGHRELEVVSEERSSDVGDHLEQPVDLMAFRGVPDEQPGLRAELRRQIEPSGVSGAEQDGELIGAGAAPMELQRQIVAPALLLEKEGRDSAGIDRDLGQAGETREVQCFVHEARVTRQERSRLRHRQERDPRAGQRAAKRAQRGDAAQLIAQAGERPQDDDMTGPEPPEGSWAALVDVLIPTCNRPAALAVTLTSVMAQSLRGIRVIVSDQSTNPGTLSESRELAAVLRVMRARGTRVDVARHMPRRGLAEQRDFLLSRATAPYVLFLDDDIILEPDLVERLLRAIRRQGCGFIGSAVIGMSHEKDLRPHQQTIEFWDGPVTPETITPGGPAWRRHEVHNAANLHHVASRLGLTTARERLYRVAWVGGCVLYDRLSLEAVGGFGFWVDLPAAHAAEDVVAQLRVMARFGGAGLVPSGAFHQELPTTVADRLVDAPWAV